MISRNLDLPKCLSNFLLIVISILFISYYLFFISHNNLDENQKVIGLLPFVFFIGSFFILLYDKNNCLNISKLIIWGSFSVRLLIYPFIVTLVNINIKNSSVELIDKIPVSVAVQIYEFIILSILIAILPNPISKNAYIIKEDFRLTKAIRQIIVLLCVLSIIGIVMFPEILAKFRTVFYFNSSQEYNWYSNFEYVKETMPKAVFYLFGWLLNILRLLIVYLIIINLWKRSNEKKPLKYIVISMLSLLSLVLFVPDDRAGSIFAIFAFMLLLTKLYPSYSSKIFRFSLISFASIITIVLIVFPILKTVKSGTTSLNDILYYMSFHLNAYFGGTVNIAASLNMGEPSMNVLWGDITHSFPVIVGLFKDIENANIIFNQTLGYDVIKYSQIIPNIGESIYYLGISLAPLFSILLLIFSFTSYKKALRAQDTFQYYIYIYQMIFFSSGIILYHFFLVVYLYILYVFPCQFIYWLFHTKKIKR